MNLKKIKDTIVDHPIVTGIITSSIYAYFRMGNYFTRFDETQAEVDHAPDGFSKLMAVIYHSLVTVEPFALLFVPATLHLLKQKKFLREHERPTTRFFEETKSEQKKNTNLLQLISAEWSMVTRNKKKAIEKTEEIIAQNPENGTAYINLIDLLFKAKRNEEAYSVMHDLMSRRFSSYTHVFGELTKRAEHHELFALLDRMLHRKATKHDLLSCVTDVLSGHISDTAKKIEKLEESCDDPEVQLLLARLCSRLIRDGVEDPQVTATKTRLYQKAGAQIKTEEYERIGESTNPVKVIHRGTFLPSTIIIKEGKKASLENEKKTNETLEGLLKDHSDVFVPVSLSLEAHGEQASYIMEREDGETLFEKIKRANSTAIIAINYKEDLKKCAQMLAFLQATFPLNTTLPERDYKKDITTRLEALEIPHAIIKKITDACDPCIASINTGKKVASFDAHTENFIIHPRGITKIDNEYTRNEALEMDHANLFCYGKYLTEQEREDLAKRSIGIYNQYAEEKTAYHRGRSLSAEVLRSVLLMKPLHARQSRRNLAYMVIENAQQALICLRRTNVYEKYGNDYCSGYAGLAEIQTLLQKRTASITQQ